MKLFKITISEKLISLIVLAGFIVICLLPLLSIAKYDHPCADDFGYGYEAHTVWDSTHNVLETLKAAVQTSIHTYNTWQGTYSSIFFMALTPVVFGEQYYFLVPYIMLGSLVLSVLFLGKTLLHDAGKSSMSQCIIICLALLLIMIEGIYTPASAFFWYNSAIHYTFMQSCMFVMLAFAIRLISSKLLVSKLINVTLCCVFAFIVAGSNYLNSLIGLLLLVSFYLYILFFYKEKKGKQFKTFLLLLAIIVYGFGFYLNVTAQGNAVRAANYVGVGLSPVASILSSLKAGFTHSVEWFSLFTLAGMLAIIPSAWQFSKRSKFRFRFPLLVIIFSFCILSAMFTSSFYSLGCSGLPRALNNAKMLYHFCLFADEIYMIGWLQKRFEKKKKEFSFQHYILYYFAIITMFFGVFLSCDNKEAYYPSYASFKYIREGFAQVYLNEYTHRLELLNGPDAVVYLDEIQPKLNVLYVDDIQTDPTDWRNMQLATWYHKQEVYLVPTPKP